MTNTSELTDQEFQESAWIDGVKEANIWRAGDLTVSPKSQRKLGTEESISNPQRQEAEAEESPAAVGQLVEVSGWDQPQEPVKQGQRPGPTPKVFLWIPHTQWLHSHIYQEPPSYIYTPQKICK